MTPEEFFARFDHLIEKTDGCWLWHGQRKPLGYGYVDLYEEGDGTRRRIYAHRTAAGTPKGKVTRHLCHNPPCVRPDHLVPGTQAENGQDTSLAGRTTAVIPPHLVVPLRVCSAAGVSTSFIASMAGCTEGAIRRLVRGETFASFGGPICTDRDHGAGHRNARLTDDAVRSIRRRAAAGEPQVSIARSLNVTPQAINQIVRGKAWRHVA